MLAEISLVVYQRPDVDELGCPRGAVACGAGQIRRIPLSITRHHTVRNCLRPRLKFVV